MSIKWRVRTMDEAGVAGATIQPAAGVDDGITVNVTAQGGSLDGALAGLRDAVYRDPDALSLFTEVSFDDGSTWTPLHAGKIVTISSPYDPDVTRVTLGSLRERLYQITITQGVVAGGDIASMVDEVLTAATLPATLSWSVYDAPTLGFTLGKRYPSLESVGAFLDAMAAAAGAFVTTANYPYDGVTYRNGDFVPPVEWGVRGDGSIYFRRATRSTLILDERSSRVLVNWAPVNAGETVDAVRLVYASEYTTNWITSFALDISGTPRPAESPAAQPLSLVAYGADVPEAERRELVVQVPNPIDLMRAETLTFTTQLNWSNFANAVDGDDATYAEQDDPMTANALANFYIDNSGGYLGGILRIVYAATDVSDNPLIVRFASAGPGPLEFDTEIMFKLPETDADRSVVFMPVLAPAEFADESSLIRVTVDIYGDTRLHALELYVPDEESAAIFAESKAPRTRLDAAEIIYDGYAAPVTTVLMRRDTGSVELAVERIEYRISREGGFQTILHTGQAYDGELLAQKAVVERLVTNVVNRGRGV